MSEICKHCGKPVPAGGRAKDYCNEKHRKAAEQRRRIERPRAERDAARAELAEKSKVAQCWFEKHRQALEELRRLREQVRDNMFVLDESGERYEADSEICLGCGNSSSKHTGKNCWVAAAVKALEGGGQAMKQIGLISPYRGSVGWNLAQAREWGKRIILAGKCPVIPHLWLTQLLCDNVPEERELGLALGREMYAGCSVVEVRTWGTGILSEGMEGDVKFCQERGVLLAFPEEA